MEKEYRELNINNQVKVKLTAYGKSKLRAEHDRFQEIYRDSKYRVPFKLPEEDKDGWSTWQMYVLMEELGKYCQIGTKNLPFETNIKINIIDLKGGGESRE